MSGVAAPAGLPLGVELEAVRLRVRVARLEAAVERLVERVDALRAVGRPVPVPLGEAIAGFAEEAGRLRARLAEIGPADARV